LPSTFELPDIEVRLAAAMADGQEILGPPPASDTAEAEIRGPDLMQTV